MPVAEGGLPRESLDNPGSPSSSCLWLLLRLLPLLLLLLSSLGLWLLTVAVKHLHHLPAEPGACVRRQVVESKLLKIVRTVHCIGPCSKSFLGKYGTLAFERPSELANWLAAGFAENGRYT